jgi:protein involved in polysaccharide export with SLBB domain
MRMKIVGSLALVGMVLSGCVTAPLPAGTPAPIEASAYRLGPGDKLRITTFNEPNLSGEFVIAGSGAVAMPLAGDIPARGLTPGELQAAIAAKLESGGFVRSPQVSAEVIEYRPYYILGEVTKPGQYPFTIGLTVSKAVATAGGFTYRANQRKVLITKDGSTEEVEVQLTASTPIGPGDTIRIAERYF